MKDIDELDALHAKALPGDWVYDERELWGCVQARASAWGILLTVPSGDEPTVKATCAFIAAAHNAWPEVSARLRAAEVDAHNLRVMLGRALVEKEKAAKVGEAPYGWIQWKGTDVCMDLYCACGEHFHLDDDFTYFTQCPKCQTVYAISANVVLVPLPEPHRDLVLRESPSMVKRPHCPDDEHEGP